MAKVIIRQIHPMKNPVLYSQVLNLRNQLLRLPLGLDLLQEDLSQEENGNHVILAAITTSIVAKSNDNKSSNNPEKIDTDKNKDEVDPSTKQDGKQDAMEDKVVGCIVLVPFVGQEKTLRIRQMAVSENFQGQGLGARLLQSAEDYAKSKGKNRLYLHGRTHAVGFYLKSGYTKLPEPEFLELGIPHHKMEKIL